MKIIANIFRVFVGLLFIFSGLIKANDPTGFSYKLDEYFSVFSADLETEQDSISIKITSDSVLIEKQIEVNALNPQIQFLLETTDWKAVPLKNGLSDSIYFSDATISLSGEVLFSKSLNAKDSNINLLEAGILASINNKILLDEEVSFKSFSQYEKVYTVDATKYSKPNTWLVNWLQSLRPYALSIAILICVLEIILGLALLIG